LFTCKITTATGDNPIAVNNNNNNNEYYYYYYYNNYEKYSNQGCDVMYFYRTLLVYWWKLPPSL